MRISDWSSDVCSSDLKYVSWLCIPPTYVPRWADSLAAPSSCAASRTSNSGRFAVRLHRRQRKVSFMSSHPNSHFHVQNMCFPDLLFLFASTLAEIGITSF